ncbi:MAG: type II toxin-antitoxin system Phd/YefM family antitoxin [Chthonomonadales bacterium]
MTYAKHQLSKVINKAETDGPQIITRRGVEVAVVVSYTNYQRLLRNHSIVGFSTANRPILLSIFPKISS